MCDFSTSSRRQDCFHVKCMLFAEGAAPAPYVFVFTKMKWVSLKPTKVLNVKDCLQRVSLFCTDRRILRALAASCMLICSRQWDWLVAVFDIRSVQMRRKNPSNYISPRTHNTSLWLCG